MGTRLYTFVVDYRGGTFVSQMLGESKRNAMSKWARTLDVEPMGVRLRRAGRLRLIAEVEEEEAVLLNGLSNVWCFTPLIGNRVAIVHLIETATRRRPLRGA